MKEYHYHLEKLSALTSTITIAFFAPTVQTPFSYRAGQYIEILYPDGSFQPFSIANAPDSSGHIELHIRHRAEDVATKNFLEQLESDKQITFRGPFGQAYYRSEPSDAIVLLAGGTGFSYIKAIMEEAIKQKDSRKFHLYWSVKINEDFYLANLPTQWQKEIKNFRYTPIVTQQEINLNLEGKIQRIPETILRDYSDFSERQVYASGPFGLVRAAYELLQQYSLSPEKMFSDMLS